MHFVMAADANSILATQLGNRKNRSYFRGDREGGGGGERVSKEPLLRTANSRLV